MKLKNILKIAAAGSFLAAAVALNPIQAKAQACVPSDTVENRFKEQISQGWAKGDTVKALAAEYRLEKITEAKRTFQEKGTLWPPTEPKPDYSWNKFQIGMALVDAVLAFKDGYQTANFPETRLVPGKNATIYKQNELNPLITHLFGSHPDNLEMALYASITTAGWLAACDLVPKYITNHFLSDDYNKYVRDVMLVSRDIYYANIIKNNINNTKGGKVPAGVGITLGKKF